MIRGRTIGLLFASFAVSFAVSSLALTGCAWLQSPGGQTTANVLIDIATAECVYQAETNDEAELAVLCKAAPDVIRRLLQAKRAGAPGVCKQPQFSMREMVKMHPYREAYGADE